MRDIIDKKLKRGKLYLLLTLVFASFYVFIFFYEDIAMFSLTANLGIVACLFVYFRYYHQFAKNMKWLSSKFMEGAANDIDLGVPTLPRSVIYCGKMAFYSDKFNLIIPYEEIIWIYRYLQLVNGIPIRRFFVIRTRDGKKFKLRGNHDEIAWLIANYVAPNSKDVILGHGTEQEQRFKEYMKQASTIGSSDR